LLALSRGNLPKLAAKALETADEALVSAVTPWEVAIKTAAGKLHVPGPVDAWFAAMASRYRLREIALDSKIACAAAALPLIHRDPFDRILVVLAQKQGLTILTSDRNIAKYENVKALWK
jgi:PIN domain nuclease of toxin-antitoxin system